MKMLKVDVSKCTGCNQCAMTCAFRYTGTYDLAKSCIQVIQWEDICLSVPLVCQQCQDAPCIDICPTDALSFHPETGAILLDVEACISCESCVEECRYNVMLLCVQPIPTLKAHGCADGGGYQVVMGDEEQRPYTCDLCGGDPLCVKACYPGALSYEEIPDDAREPFFSFARTLVARKNGGGVEPPQGLGKDIQTHASS